MMGRTYESMRAMEERERIDEKSDGGAQVLSALGSRWLS